MPLCQSLPKGSSGQKLVSDNSTDIRRGRRREPHRTAIACRCGGRR
jgi:hypothetical protein